MQTPTPLLGHRGTGCTEEVPGDLPACDPWAARVWNRRRLRRPLQPDTAL